MPLDERPDWKRVFGIMYLPEVIEALAVMLQGSLGMSVIVAALSRLKPWQRIAVGREFLRALEPREKRLFRTFVEKGERPPSPELEEIWTHKKTGRRIRVCVGADGLVLWFERMDSLQVHFGLWFLRVNSRDEFDAALYFTGPSLTEFHGVGPDPELSRDVVAVLAEKP